MRGRKEIYFWSKSKITLCVLALIFIAIDPSILPPVKADGDGFLNTSFTWEGFGGYVARGVGTWNSTSGSITIQNIPQGATIERAYIYWVCPSNIGLDFFIYINGQGVTGTQIGVDGIYYSYRANITSLVTGNGNYEITDITNAYGASIVAVYSDSSSNYVKVIINDGQDTDYNNTVYPHWLTETIFSGFIASTNPLATVTYILGDGQTYYQGAWRHDKYSFNGKVIAEDHADGSDGNPTTHGWDTDTYNVSLYVLQGDTTATANLYEENDELLWASCVFSVTIEPPFIPPIADAGKDQVANEGEIVQLNGTGSYDPDAVYYRPAASCVDISGNGDYIAIGWDMNVSFFHISSNIPIWTYNTGGYVEAVVLSDYGQKLAVAYNDPPKPYGYGSHGNVAFFETSIPIPQWTNSTDYPICGSPRRAIDMTRDGSLIVVGTYLWFAWSAEHVGTIYVFDTTSPNPIQTYSYPDSIMSVRISGNGEFFAVGSYWQNMRFYSVSSGFLWTVSIADPYYSVALDYSASYIATGHGFSGEVNLYNHGGAKVWERSTGGIHDSMAMDDAGYYFIVSQYKKPWYSFDGVRFFNTSSSIPVWSYQTPEGQRTVDMARDASNMVSGGRDGNVSLFKSGNSISIYTYNIRGFVKEVSMSGDGYYYASVSSVGSLYLFTTLGSPQVVWAWTTPLYYYPGPVKSYNWDFDANVDSDGDGNYTNDADATGSTSTHIYGDDGIYTVTLTVTDNQNLSDTDTCIVIVNNVLPTIEPFGPFIIDEGNILNLDGNSTDPGSDDLTFTWSWGDGTSDTIKIYYNDGIGPDPYQSPWGTFPFSIFDSVQHTYNNYGNYTLNLTVEDDDGGIKVYTTDVTVVGISPPILYINTSQDGHDVILYWNPPSCLGIDHYLIYRSESQTEFNFGDVWVNTSSDIESGELTPIPLRTMWNDTNAAFPGNVTNYAELYYYIIRAVNIFGRVSRTSRTVGKWTKMFPQKVSTFSLPLEPIETLYTDHYTSSMKAEYIKYINITTHEWMQHNRGDGIINNTQMKLGEGFEVKFINQTNFTFTGLPGAMISYDDNNGFLGFDNPTAKNLTVSVESNGDVNLSWQEPSSMTNGWYEVYYSNKRDGFFGTPGIHYKLACPAIGFGTNTIYITGLGANDPGSRLYFMVVPFNASGLRGASTYSIGVWTEEYTQGYDTFGIPLRLTSNQTADWYCDNIPDTVGINYYILNEQRWCWHSTIMPAGAYDPVLEMTEGYQVSTSGFTKFTFIGR